MATRKKKSTKKNRMALIDGEIMCYHMVTNPIFLREESNDVDEYWEVLDMDACMDEVDLRIKQILSETKSKNFAMFFGSKENFRKKLSQEYKAHRKSKKPLGYHALVNWCYQEYDCVDLPLIEADDTMGIYHTDSKLNGGVETVMVSNDKDMRQIPGLLYDHTRPENGVVTITELDGAIWWATQTLVGDTADGYKGCPGIGIKGAEDLLSGSQTSKLKGLRLEKYLYKMVESIFLDKGLGKKDALLQARLSRILRKGEYDMKKEKPILWKP